MQNYTEILSEQFARRKQWNSRYSLRAFARFLQISPSALANIMNGRYALSDKRAAELSTRLALSSSQAEIFCQTASKKTRSGASSETPLQKWQSTRRAKHLVVESLLEKAITSPLHLGILQALSALGNSAKLDSLEVFMGVPESKLKLALQDLKGCGLVKSHYSSWALNGDPNLITADDLSSESIRQYHRQALAMAHLAVDLDLHEREFQSMVVKIRRADLSKFKEKIRQFFDEFEFLTEDASKAGHDDVYMLSSQFFPIGVAYKEQS